MVDKHQNEYRAAVYDITGQTLPKIVFGREVRLPCYLVVEVPEQKQKEILDYVDQLRNRLLDTYALVRTRIKMTSDRMKARNDLKANYNGFQKSDKVWLYNPLRKKGKSSKLSLS